MLRFPRVPDRPGTVPGADAPCASLSPRAEFSAARRRPARRPLGEGRS